jgi:hypothetical protein
VLENRWHSRTTHSRVPHPDSSAGRTFDWASLGVQQPNSPAGQQVHWEPGVRNKQISANRDNLEKLRLAGGTRIA